MEIQIANRQRRHRVDRKRIATTARIALGALKHPDAELSILLVGDRRIAALNRAWLDRDGPTNVIAFPMRPNAAAPAGGNLLGDVVISVDTARRESAAAGIGLQERLAALLIHGILHLCGYDHETGPRQARRMAGAARRLMRLAAAAVE
jgi:probable rRNA maturation factor